MGRCRIKIIYLSVPCFLLLYSGYAASETAAPTKDVEYRYLEGSDTTFRLKGAALAGKAAPLALSVLNWFGTRKQISDGLASHEEQVRRLLRASRMPGVLIYVEHQTSMSDVQVTTLVSGKPQIIGPGIDQLSTWKAYNSNGQNDLKPRTTQGYRTDESASYFLWATERNRNIEYGLTTPATLILNEARRAMSDYKLREAFSQRYDNELRSKLVENIERAASEKPVREQAKALRAARQKALEEKRRIDVELQQALERAAKAEATAKVFDTLAQVLTVAQLGASLAAEFPDSAPSINNAQSTSDLRTIFNQIMTDSQNRSTEAAGHLQTYEDKQRNLRLEEMTVIRAQKIRPEEIPGILP